MRKFKVVITDYEYENLNIEENLLSELNVELITAQCKSEEEVIAVCNDADGILNQYAPITKKVIQSLENCKVISTYGIGVDTIDVHAATERKIYVANVP